MMKDRIKWKKRFPCLPEYHCGGYIYYLGDDGVIEHADMWCILRKPEGGYKKKKFKTFKSMLEFLVPQLSTEGKREGDCEADLEFFSMGAFSCQSLRSAERDGHKYALDMTSKEIWEYFDTERISPLFGCEKEAREWADEYLPREYEQMSLFDEDEQ